MKKILKWFFIIILVILVLIVLIIGYFGFIPGLSTLMGSTKPRNLGVKYSKSDDTSYRQKAGMTSVSLTNPTADGKSLVFSEAKEKSVSLTEAEVSARISYSVWKNMPLTNFQIRFPGDNIIEFSANLATDRLSGFISEVGGVKISQSDIDSALSYLKILSKNTPVYAKAQVTVKDNLVDVKMQKLEIGRIPIPLDNWDADESFTNMVQDIMSKVPGLNAKSVIFAGGKMTFEGTAPTKIELLLE